MRSILSTATFKQSQITIISTVVNGALGGLFYILLARFLGPINFGLLTVSIATLTLIADIADLGFNTGLVKFVSSHLYTDQDKAYRFLKLSLEVKIVVWLTVLLLGFLLSPIIAGNIFNKVELTTPLRLVMLGVGGVLLFSFAASSLQAMQKYFTWSILNISTNFLRIVVIFGLLFYQQLNLTTALLTYITLPFFGFILSFSFLPMKKILSAKKESELAAPFFKFNFWIAAFTTIAAISSRLDTFIAARLLTAQEIGIYGSASQLVQVIPQIIGALGVVAAPKFAGFQNSSAMTAYFKKFQIMVLGIAALGLLVIPICVYLIPVLYGIQYIQATEPFIILFLAMLVFLISVPLHNCIIFYFGKPKVFLWVSIGHLIIISFLGFLLIPAYGVIGAALSVLIGTIFNFIAPLIWFIRRIRK